MFNRIIFQIMSLSKYSERNTLFWKDSNGIKFHGTKNVRMVTDHDRASPYPLWLSFRLHLATLLEIIAPRVGDA